MKRLFCVLSTLFIVISIIGCGYVNSQDQVEIEQYKPNEEEQIILNMHYIDMDVAQKVELDNLIDKCKGMDHRVVKDINIQLNSLQKEKEDYYKLEPVQPNYIEIFNKNFKGHFIYLNNVTASNIDNNKKLCVYPNMLITEKANENQNNLYMLCYKDEKPIKDKNGIQIKENDILNISRAEVPNLDLAGLPRIYVYSKDIEIIH